LINQYAAKHNITVSDSEVNASAIGNYFGGVSINFKSTKKRPKPSPIGIKQKTPH
jgi:hypothetical protein